MFRRTALKHGIGSEKLTRAKEKWSLEFLELVNIEIDVEGEPCEELPCLFVANHLSFFDGVLVWINVNVNFLSHGYVGRLPFIGSALKAMGFIFVEENASRSDRGAVIGQLKKAVVDDRRRMMLFPSGKTGIENQYNWKLGTFKLAYKEDFLIQPIMLHLDPVRETAFIDDDGIIEGLMRLAYMKKGRAWVKYLKPRKILSPKEDSLRAKAEIDEIREPLLKYGASASDDLEPSENLHYVANYQLDLQG